MIGKTASIYNSSDGSASHGLTVCPCPLEWVPKGYTRVGWFSHYQTWDHTEKNTLKTQSCLL